MPGTFPTLSFGESFKYPVKRKLIQRVGVDVFCDLSTSRYKKGTGLIEFEFQYERISLVNKNALRTFYMAQGGEFAHDWTLTFDGVTYNDCQFVGNFQSTNVTTKLWNVTLKVRALQHAPPAIASAVLTIWTEYVQLGGPSPGFAATIYSIDGGATYSNAIVGSVPYPAGSGDPDPQYPLTETTFVIPPADAVNIVSFLTASWPAGTLFADGVHDEMRIYDTWLDVTYVDATTAQLRGGAAYSSFGETGGVVNAGLAVDADSSPPATYGYAFREHFSGIAVPTSLIVAYG